MGSFFGGGGNKTTTSTQTSAPWGPVQPYLLDAMQSAQNLYNQGIPQMYSGQYLPAQSAQTTGAIGGITDLTNSGVLQQLISGAQGTAQNVASGANQGGGNAYLQQLLQGLGVGSQYAGTLANQLGTGNQAQASAQGTLTGLASGQNLTSNPFLQQVYQQASTPIVQQFQNQIQPGIDATFSSAGRYGRHLGGSLDTTQNQAETALGQALGSLGANLGSSAYQTGVQQQTNALNTLANLGLGQTSQQLGLGSLLQGLQGQQATAAQGLNQQQLQQGQLQLQGAQSIPGLANAAFSPYQALGAAGQTMDQYNTQNQLYQEQLYNYLNGQGAWQTLQNYTNLLNTNPASRGQTLTGTTTAQAPTQSLFGQILGGVAGGASLLGSGGLSGLMGGTMGGLFGGQTLGGALGNLFNNSYGYYGAPGSTTTGGWTNVS